MSVEWPSTLRLAKREGYTVVGTYIDEGKSAKNIDRPELQAMIDFCDKNANMVSAIIVWRLDRLSRNTTDYHGTLLPLLSKKGITLLSATEPNSKTAEGELMRNIGVSFAEYERKGLKIVYERNQGISKQVKSEMRDKIEVLENRIEKSFIEKIEGNISNKQWNELNRKWIKEKDLLEIQLSNMSRLDKEFNQKVNDVLSFTEND